MYAADVDDDSDATESSASKSQKTSKVSALSETKTEPRQATVISILPQSKQPPPPKKAEKTEEGISVRGNQFVALVHRKAVNKGDLTVQKGDVLKIHSIREDGWWMAETAKGERGMVPKNILRHCATSEEKPKKQQLMKPESQKPKKTVRVKSPPKRRKIDPDFHNTLECHMSLRLSESNWSFHDLFWNSRLKTIQKRHVFTCKMFRIEKLMKYHVAGQPLGHYIRMCLFDKSANTGRQVVSNYHYVCPQFVQNGIWTFAKKKIPFRPQFKPEFFVRSNYKMHKVVLRFEVISLLKEGNLPVRHAKSFFTEIPILDERGQSLLKNGSRNIVLEAPNVAYNGDTPTMAIHISDIPRRYVRFCDMLPDVLIWNPSFFRISAGYRVGLGHFVRSRQDPTCAGEA
ncbi:hypothetical protein L596_001580 [Steinernema carpocapsae]|uniref:SH3 domain-containing protein n=1 Tax=Steinernema carpocapsae TaxID=34508 RepID=A0A4U8ULV9_STECR|nr:hypothetical protein L596_001580 [Steinernema carpocapsae]